MSCSLRNVIYNEEHKKVNKTISEALSLVRSLSELLEFEIIVRFLSDFDWHAFQSKQNFIVAHLNVNQLGVNQNYKLTR